MRESLLSLQNFIHAYNLNPTNGTICFDAKIYFTFSKNTYARDSEVCIKMEENNNVVYLKNTAIGKEKLPDIFNIKKHRFSYIRNQYLKIESDVYVISIFPERK